MPDYIVNEMPVATTDAMKTALNTQITAIQNFKVALNNEQKMGSRTMAVGREGLARMVSQIAKANINSLTRDMDPAKLAAKLNYDARLEEVRQLALRLLETIFETQLANGIDAMAQVDAFTATLQASRKYNASLDLAMQEVDEWNSRFVPNSNSTALREPPAF